jgi:hypothetical protein
MSSVKFNPYSFVIAALLSFSITVTNSQSLVPNGGFEEHTGCPNILSIFYTNVEDWYGGIAVNVDTSSESEGSANWPSPDWFHACGTAVILSTPLNIGGFQEPFEGDAYGGFINYSAEDEYREIISVPLTDTLTPGEAYNLTFSLSRGSMRQNRFSTSRIGFRFTTFESYTSTEELVSSWTHGEIEEVVNDTTGWQEYTFEFLADSSYQYLHFGNFYRTDEIQIQVDEGEHSQPPLLAYYYIDGVSLAHIEPLNTDLAAESSTNVFPNPSNGVFQISFAKVVTESTISVINMDGRVVHREIARDHLHTINLAPHGAGIYIVVIESASDVTRYRIVVN